MSYFLIKIETAEVSLGTSWLLRCAPSPCSYVELLVELLNLLLIGDAGRILRAQRLLLLLPVHACG